MPWLPLQQPLFFVDRPRDEAITYSPIAARFVPDLIRSHQLFVDNRAERRTYCGSTHLAAN